MSWLYEMLNWGFRMLARFAISDSRAGCPLARPGADLVCEFAERALPCILRAEFGPVHVRPPDSAEKSDNGNDKTYRPSIAPRVSPVHSEAKFSKLYVESGKCFLGERESSPTPIFLQNWVPPLLTNIGIGQDVVLGGRGEPRAPPRTTKPAPARSMPTAA